MSLIGLSSLGLFPREGADELDRLAACRDRTGFHVRGAWLAAVAS